MEAFTTVRQQGRADAEAAASAGLDAADFVWRLPVDVAGPAQAYASGVEELRRLAEDGRLLTPPPDPEVADLRRWIARHIAGQVTGVLVPAPFKRT